MKNNIYPCLWMQTDIQEASEFYLHVFKDSIIISSNPMAVLLQIKGSYLMLLNGGPKYTFSEAISLVIPCETQEEIDEYWHKLGESGSYSKCGWLKDKYGVSWQVVPAILNKLMNDPKTSTNVIYELMQMDKIIIEKLN
ncbi:MAG: VOC family protein [Bacteroidia bacterium]|nr:VOC family protein [Bacteroidia bacterium]